MSASAFQGPLIAFGRSGSDTNPERAPSLFDMGVALLDLRSAFRYEPGQSRQAAAVGWFGSDRIKVIDQVPATAADNNIAAAQVPAAGTAMTLVSASGAGITAGVSITRADTGATVTGLLAIDEAMAQITPSTNGPVRLWDPRTAIARCVRVVSVGNDTGATFTIRGYDIYGFPMTEVVTGANAATATSVKAFKYIASVTPAGTVSGSNVSIGVSDVIGLPLRADLVSDVDIVMADAKITASTGFTAAVTTDPATNITGDVRGRYTLQTASNGTRRLVVYINPAPNRLTEAGLFGVTQFDDF